MINSRKKGTSYERELAQKFRDNGFPECLTSRHESKRLDDAGVDLCFTGDWLVQAKAVEKLSPSVHEVLKRMPEGMRVVFWKKNRLGTTVCMPEELFWSLLKLYESENKR